MFKDGRRNRSIWALIALTVLIVTMLAVAACGEEAADDDAVAEAPGTTAVAPDSTGATTAEPVVDEEDLITIKTWSRTDCSSTPWIVADKKGFLAAEGLKLEYTGDTQPTQQIPSILNGNNDIGEWHPNTYAVAIATGAELIGFAPCGIEPKADVDEKFRHMWWFVKPDSGITSFADLKDYKPGEKLKFSTISTNICADFLANTILDLNGIPRDRVEWISMPDVQAIQALSQGLVDVGGVHPPFYKGMQDSGAVKIGDSSEAGLGDTAGITFYVASKEFIEQNPDVINRFTRAMIKAQKWANENYLEAAQLTEEAIGQPVNGYHYYATSSKIDDALIVPWIEYLEGNGAIKEGALQPTDVITHDFEQPDL